MNNPPLVLIVDDEENFREIFSTKLEEVGYKVETAVNGELGFEKAKETKPDLILMDMEMPVLNGAGATMKLREDKETQGIKIVFLTNYGDPRSEMREADIHFSKEIGANDYLRKTDDLDRIADKVKEMLEVGQVVESSK
ncbi:MAG: response regulator [Patescibacteria group bacterium]